MGFRLLRPSVKPLSSPAVSSALPRERQETEPSPILSKATPDRGRLAEGSRLWLLVPLLAQLLLLLYYYPPSDIFGNAPLARSDYATHFSTTVAVKWFIENAGRTWGYDPYFLAGWPTGTVFDVDNKAFELLTYALSRVIPIPVAFNIVALAAVAGFPWFLYAAARILGLPVRTAALGALLALGLWYLDPAVRGLWQTGTIAFSTASYLAVFGVCLFLRCFQVEDTGSFPQPTSNSHPRAREGRRSATLWLCLSVLGPVVLLAHILGPALMAIPLGIHLATNWRRIGLPRFLVLIAWCGLILAVNWYWLSTLLRFFNLKTESGAFLLGGLDTLWTEFAGSGLGTWATGKAPFFRLIVMALAVAGLLSWRRMRRSAAAAIGPAVVILLLAAYLGIYVPQGSNLEPYRFLVPALFFAVLPAAEALPGVLAAICRNLASHSSLRVYGVGMAVLVAFWQLGLATWEYRPHLKVVGHRLGSDQLIGPSEDYRGLMHYLARNTNDEGRILVTDWVLAALVPYFTGRQVIGGPSEEVFLTQGYANADIVKAFGRPYAKYDPSQLRTYLTAYNIRWVVTDARFDGTLRFPFTFDELARRFPDLVTREAEVGDFNVYRVTIEPSYFLEGCGRATASYDRIAVEGACPGTVVLKYHWLDTLRSEPELPLERVEVLDDPAGFIRVRNGEVTSFVINNRP